MASDVPKRASVARSAHHLLEVAKAQYQLVDDDSETERDGLLLGSIITAAASIEARVYEVWSTVIEPPLDVGPWTYVISEPARLLAFEHSPLSDQRTSAVSRVQMLARVLNVTPPELGSEPLQSWNVLRQVRNAIVHPRPSIATQLVDGGDWSFTPHRDSLISGLNARLPAKIFEADEDFGMPSWSLGFLEAVVAEFAIETAIGVFNFLYEMQKEKADAEGMNWPWLEHDGPVS